MIRHEISLAAHSFENAFSTRTTEIHNREVRTARRISTHDGAPKEKNVLRKADPTAVTFWQTASLLHLSTAHVVNGFHQIEHSSVRAGAAHQVNAQSYHPRRVSHTAPQTSKSISYLSSV